MATTKSALVHERRVAAGAQVANAPASRIGNKELAAHLGVHVDVISTYQRKGVISPTPLMTDPVGHDLDKERVAFIADLRDQILKKQQSPAMDVGKTRKMTADAELAEINLAQKRNELVLVADVKLVWETAIIRTRTKIQGRTAKLAPRLANLPVEQIAAILDKENAEILVEFSKEHMNA
jgi:hypothetical protein